MSYNIGPSLLRPVKREPEKTTKPDEPVNPGKPVRLEPTGRKDEMDFSKICSGSSHFPDLDDDDIPDLEICDE